MLRSISYGKFQEGRIKGDPVSMTSQWSISKKQNLLHLNLLRTIQLRLRINSRIINRLAWLSRNMTGNRKTRVFHLFSIQLKEMCLWHRCVGFLPTNQNHQGVMYFEAHTTVTSFPLSKLCCKCNLCSINELAYGKLFLRN